MGEQLKLKGNRGTRASSREVRSCLGTVGDIVCELCDEVWAPSQGCVAWVGHSVGVLQEDVLVPDQCGELGGGPRVCSSLPRDLVTNENKTTARTRAHEADVET